MWHATFAEMLQTTTTPNVVTFNTVIRTLCRAGLEAVRLGRLQQAWGVVEMAQRQQKEQDSEAGDGGEQLMPM